MAWIDKHRRTGKRENATLMLYNSGYQRCSLGTRDVPWVSEMSLGYQRCHLGTRDVPWVPEMSLARPFQTKLYLNTKTEFAVFPFLMTIRTPSFLYKNPSFS